MVTVNRLERLTDARALVLLVAIAIVGDLLTTAYGLSIGLKEGSPLVRATLESYGIMGFIGLKFILIPVVWLLWRDDQRYGKAALLGVIVVHAIAVISNVITIVSH